MATGKSPLYVAIVDDDLSMREALENLLHSAGLRTRSYASAELFLSSRQARKVSCLLVDMDLAGRSGLQLHIQLREDGVTTPTILMTGAPIRGELHQRAVAAGVRAVIHKPFDGEALLKLLRSAFPAGIR